MDKKKPVFDQRVIDLVNDYINNNQNPDTLVTLHLPPEVLRQKIDLSLPEEGCSQDELYAIIEQYLSFSVRTGHRQFFNQLWSGFSFPGLLGELFSSLTNTSMYTYEVAPVATLMETECVHKMGAICGFKNPEGLLLSGGSNGNLQAMMIARNQALPNLKKKGFPDSMRLTAFISEESHYSYEKNANILGIGTENVRKIKTNNRGEMIPSELALAIDKSLQQGEHPFFVGATAGTVIQGAFDPFEEIAAIAQQNNVWFHVDGSFGGSILLSPKHRFLIKGLENADSFIWNAHKLMGLPIICSVFLVREKGYLIETNSVSGTDYIFHDEVYGNYDLGSISLQCGRKVDSLKLWLAWKYYGDKGYAQRIDHLFELAEHAEKIVSENPALELMVPRSSLNICFRYLPSLQNDLNLFNLKLREELARSGKSMVNYAYLGKNLVIRLVITNPELKTEDIDLFFSNLMETAQSLERN
ncbi:MAG: aspartate aminotransferase family protein [Candidatus Aminicenantes bacterium]|nr:aspartate aminotransferase family protein [Candidatus Aminicenantes bacterium]